MNNNTRQAIINRITMLRARGTNNGNIIKKLERRLRKLGDNA